MPGSESPAGDLLAGLRVLDLGGAVADPVSRILADLGADVLKVEPPGGSAARSTPPTLAGTGIAFALHNANKRATVLDPTVAGDRERLVELAGAADIVVDSGLPGRAAAYGAPITELADRFDHLVALSVTDFGRGGPRAHWQATDAVLYALSGALSRSGPTVGTPVLPPTGIASATAAVQAAWAALVAYYNRLRCGQGDFIDFSRFEAVVTTLDPAFGTQGQAAVARRDPGRWRGRPRNQNPYPIFACRDGHVRMCLLSPRQWRGLRAWLGEPAEFQDARFDTIAARYAAWTDIGRVVAELFADQTMADLVAAGQAHGVPLAEVLPASDALRCKHFSAVGAVTDIGVTAGVEVVAPSGYYVVDGDRRGYRRPAPAVGDDAARWGAAGDGAPGHSAPGHGAPGDAALPAGAPPLTGVRIVDLGVIVAGGELSRLFADLGAEVIKVESAAFPDGLRQTRPGQALSDSFAWAHRNSESLGLELRSRAGAELLGELVRGADALFANFKPGTLASLGFTHDRLRELNPRLVVAESSAYGEHGPWSTRMGYGPLVRAATGLTGLWTSPQAPADSGRLPLHEGFFDATSIFPDHVAARVGAIGALAALIRAARDGRNARGARIHVSQAEVVLNQLDTVYVGEAARRERPGQFVADPAVDAVCECAGDDQWCVISIRHDGDWQALAAALGAPALAADPRWRTAAARADNRAVLVAELAAYTRTRAPHEVAALLQRAGVPAAAMNRADDVFEEVQRGPAPLLTEMRHPLIDHPLPTETRPARFRYLPPAPLRPAPLPGQHTRQVCRRVLGLGDAQIDRLLAEGVLFTGPGTAEDV
ncbi:CaiB/BaiF CoA-transferase family protein [Mycolicibacterium palauense]|uniref:CaiB/BaiF CoA-transferase family protein n=1 Tax=Mycolicibacterium palauense TaxID=2034511 RepID=UPI000BFECD6C|nr:CoA transferase [Mycolicibacterium palauense]